MAPDLYTLFWGACALVGLWRIVSGLRDGCVGDPFGGTVEAQDRPGYFAALLAIWLVFSIGSGIAAWMTARL